MERSNRKAVQARQQLLRNAGFEMHARHGIWINASLRKIISETVVATINVTQLGCWIKRPAPPSEWSAWFHRPLRIAVLNNIIRDCVPPRAPIKSRTEADLARDTPVERELAEIIHRSRLVMEKEMTELASSHRALSAASASVPRNPSP